jgi:hypothetical protein
MPLVLKILVSMIIGPSWNLLTLLAATQAEVQGDDEGEEQYLTQAELISLVTYSRDPPGMSTLSNVVRSF